MERFDKEFSATSSVQQTIHEKQNLKRTLIFKMNCFYIPKPNIKQQIVNPAREKSILYKFSIMMMHALAAAKCLGEEKTMCNLQKRLWANSQHQNPNIIQSIPDQFWI